MPKPSLLSNKQIIFIFCIAFILRMVLFFIIKPYSERGKQIILSDGDANSYYLLADGLLQNKGFESISMELSMLRTPGYPGFIALIYSVFGVNLSYVIILQILLDCILACLLAHMTNIVFLSNKISLITGLLWGIEPFAIMYSNRLLSENLFIFFIIIAIIYLINFLKTEKLFFLLFSSISIALSAYIRPISLVIIIFFLLFLFVFEHFQKIFKYITIYTLVFILIISPWIIRNKIIHNHLFFSIAGDINALVLYAAPVIADEKGMSEYQVINTERNKLVSDHFDLMESDLYLFYKQFKYRAVEIVLNDPLRFLKTTFIGFVDLYFSIERNLIKRILDIKIDKNTDFISSSLKNGLVKAFTMEMGNHIQLSIYSYLMIIYLFLQYFLIIVGIFNLVKKKMTHKLIFFMFPVLYLTLIYGAAGIGRFKFTIIPFYLPIISFGISIFHRNYLSCIRFLKHKLGS